MVKDFNLPASLTQVINGELAYKYRIVPIDRTEENISFISDSVDEDVRNELQIMLGTNVRLKKEDSSVLQQYLLTNYRESPATSNEDLYYSNNFLETILLFAKDIGSSDIHFEPYENKCRVRLRLDGKLKEQYVVPLTDYPKIVNQIKIKAGLDISEKRLPQDGRITIHLGNIDFDIRVSTLPTLFGEKIVMRILSKDTNNISLDHLGFTKKEIGIYQEHMRKPNGIILISGPTGSGKTTTLYATLKQLNTNDTNILTIEDPIEYTLEGINQVQLKENIGMDFASTLRTFLRQDPDIIMVGEIRDVKTANMAIRSALTGHLVLSTIHTNSAWATISRLIDMGIPPFLIATTLNMSVAQRLVRLLCSHCKKESAISETTFPIHFVPPNSLKKHFKAVGCDKCHFTGYKGRKAIYEVLPITKTLTPYIKASELSIDAYMKKQKIVTLKNNAIELITSGLTSVDETYTLLTD